MRLNILTRSVGGMTQAFEFRRLLGDEAVDHRAIDGIDQIRLQALFLRVTAYFANHILDPRRINDVRPHRLDPGGLADIARAFSQQGNDLLVDAVDVAPDIGHGTTMCNGVGRAHTRFGQGKLIFTVIGLPQKDIPLLQRDVTGMPSARLVFIKHQRELSPERVFAVW